MSARIGPRRAERVKERTDLLRLMLLEHLGNFCSECFTSYELEVNHIDGCTWNQRTAGRAGRWVRYWREILAGVRIDLRCRSCNGGYLNNRRGKYE